MIVKLNELEEGTASLDWEETPEDLHIQDEDLQFSGPIKTRIEFVKLGESISATGRTNAVLRLECVRCLEPVSFSLSSDFKFVFQKNRPESMTDDEDETMIWLDESGDKVDLGEEIKDYILLEMPLNPLCKTSCEGLCPICGENLNQTQCNCSSARTDPRWEALRALKDQS